MGFQNKHGFELYDLIIRRFDPWFLEFRLWLLSGNGHRWKLHQPGVKRLWAIAWRTNLWDLAVPQFGIAKLLVEKAPIFHHDKYCDLTTLNGHNMVNIWHNMGLIVIIYHIILWFMVDRLTFPLWITIKIFHYPITSPYIPLYHHSYSITLW